MSRLRRGASPVSLRTLSRKGDGQAGFWSVAVILMLFGVLSLATGLYYDANDSLLTRQAIKGVETVGPFEVAGENVVIEVETQLNLPIQRWAFGELTLLTADEEPLTAFGGEFWHETGRDSDGPWRSVENRFRHKLTIPRPGLYRIGFDAEWGQIGVARGVANPTLQATVTVRTTKGSAIPHMTVGLGLIFLSVLAQAISDHRAGLFISLVKAAFGLLVGLLVLRSFFG